MAIERPINVPQDEEFFFNHFFVNNCLGSFYKGVLNWMADIFYDRFNYRIIGTYEKSVEYFNKLREKGREIDTNILPSVTLDPSLDFEPAEQGGRFMWQSQSLAPGLGRRLFDDIEFPDQEVRITPVFSRYQGTFEMIFWLKSVYEVLDFRVMLMQFSSGYNRILRPTFFDTFLVLPYEIYNYETSEGVPLDWSGTLEETKLVKNIDQYRPCYPCKLTPWFKFTSITDGSIKYGADSITESKMTASVEYEVDLPTYMVLKPHVGPIRVNINFEMSAVYSRYGTAPIVTTDGNIIKNPNRNVPDIQFKGVGGEGENLPMKSEHYRERAFYEFTDADEEKDSFVLVNPFDTTNSDLIELVSYTGPLEKDNEWVLADDFKTITVNIEGRTGEMIEMYYYELDEGEKV